MSFQPQVPLAGIAGWRLLQRTEANQQAAFSKGPELARDVDYFKAHIGSVKTAADLVGDRRLLKVALGAFGLQDEIDKKAFIRKVLEGSTSDPTSLASKLTDPAFKKITDAFGFGDLGGAKTGGADFATTITEAYKTRAFEAAVGDSNDDMRLALNFKREIADLANQGDKGGSWYSVMGSKPLAQVIQKAFGLPTAFGKLDVDHQRDVLRQKASTILGSSDLSVFKDPAKVEKVIDRFLARSQIDAGPTAPNVTSGALTLLQYANGSSSSQGLFNLLSSLGR